MTADGRGGGPSAATGTAVSGEGRVAATLLGCGGSLGVPVLGIGWGTVDPAEPRNRRTRPSLLVEFGEEQVLVDATPDCRDQLLAAGRSALDLVLFTHEHADHVHGIDDLRPLTFGRGRPLPAFANAATIAALEARFGYAVTTVEMDRGLYRPILELREMPPAIRRPAGEIQSFVQAHGSGTSLGFRFGPIAYSTDASDLSAAVLDALHGVPVWIVDACREEPHPSHAHLARTLEWIAEVRPGLAVLTHMNHTMDYRRLCESLPPGVIPGHDGLRIEVVGDGSPRIGAAAPIAPVAGPAAS